MDSNSLTESLVSEQDLENFRSIFEPSERQEEPPLITDNLENDTKDMNYRGTLRTKSISVAVLLVLLLICLYIFFWPGKSLSLFITSDSLKASHKRSKNGNGRRASVYELTMTPNKTNNIKVFGVRTTQAPPSMVIDAEYFFPDGG